MVLLMGLLILLVLTIIGITAIKGTTQQERMAAANQQNAQTFLAADASINVVFAHMRGEVGANVSSGTPSDTLMVALNNGYYPAPAAYPPGSTLPTGRQVVTVTANAGEGFDSSANVYATGTTAATGSSFGKFAAFQFDINAQATQPATDAVSNNIQGVSFVGPAPQE